MNKAEVFRMARIAGIDSVQQYDSDTSTIVLLERFAALVASAERQRINDEAKAHLQELRKNFDVESAELRLHMWSQEKQA